MRVGNRLVACIAISALAMAVPGLLLGQQVPKDLGSSIGSPRDAKVYLERTLSGVEAGTTILLPFEYKTTDGKYLSLEEYVSLSRDKRPKILEPLRVPVGVKELDLRLRAAKISAQERKRVLAEIVADSKSNTKKHRDQLAAINKLLAHESPHEPPLGDGMMLWAPEYEVRKGERISVKVHLINAKDVRNLDFALKFNSSFVGVQGQPVRGAVVTELAESNLERPGHLKFNFARLAPFTYRGPAEVAGFTFEGLNVGITPLTLSFSEGNKLPIKPIHGSINVYEGSRPPGTQWPPPITQPPGTGWEPTCSGTGRQTINDAQCCLQIWVGLKGPNPSMDQDGDGVVDSTDALIIMDRLAARGEYRPAPR